MVFAMKDFYGREVVWETPHIGLDHVGDWVRLGCSEGATVTVRPVNS